MPLQAAACESMHLIPGRTLPSTRYDRWDDVTPRDFARAATTALDPWPNDMDCDDDLA